MDTTTDEEKGIKTHINTHTLQNLIDWGLNSWGLHRIRTKRTQSRYRNTNKETKQQTSQQKERPNHLDS